MSAKEKLSAYFTGLVDLCVGDDDQLLFMTMDDGVPIFLETAGTVATPLTPPDREHFPFTLPRASEVAAYVQQDDPHLYRDVLAYLQRFSALDDLQWSVVAHYVFLTYLHDHREIDYCPYILFYAVPERGKSRTGKSVSYLAFRGIHLIELREANIFRYSENLHGTLFFDLMDVWHKAEKSGCEDILLLRAEKGATCCRVLHPDKGAFKDTVYYSIYGPTIIASNEQLHKILDTRCLPIVMPNRPGNYENPRQELALELKERLTAWRAKTLSCKLPHIAPMEEISGRLWDISKPLFQISAMVNPLGFNQLHEAIQTIAGERSESKKETVEGHLTGIIKDLSAEQGLEQLPEWDLKTSDILHKFNENRPSDKQVTPQWIGRKLKTMSLRHRTVNGRSEIILNQRDYWTILSQFGYSCGMSLTPYTKQHETLPENLQANQCITGDVGSGRDYPESWDEEYEERAAILEYDGRISREEAERRAYEETSKIRQ